MQFVWCLVFRGKSGNWIISNFLTEFPKNSYHLFLATYLPALQTEAFESISIKDVIRKNPLVWWNYLSFGLEDYIVTYVGTHSLLYGIYYLSHLAFHACLGMYMYIFFLGNWVDLGLLLSNRFISITYVHKEGWHFGDFVDSLAVVIMKTKKCSNEL
jgi:hypothetical protein